MTQGTDTGMAEITRMLAVPPPGLTAQGFSTAATPAENESGPGFELNIAAGLTAAIGNLVTELEADRRRKEQLALDVSYVSTPGEALTALPGAMPNAWGPNARYVWAVQRLTIAGFGATSDFVTVYRGNSPNDAVAGNALFTFQEAVAGGVATWHPGRTGLILAPEESLVFGGTFTGTQLVISADVIQLATPKLPIFLL